MSGFIDFHSIIVSGPDVITFLQGQLTCDINSVSNTPSLGAYCNVKGRVLANFWILKAKENYQLLVPSCLVELVLTTLKKYGAFSKVDITSHQIPTDHLPVDANRLNNINKGIVFIFQKTSQLFTPQMIAWETVGGISFEKGCYLGQEVIARTQYLGKLKRHLHKFKQANTVACYPGDELVNLQGQVVGIVCDAVVVNNEKIGLAVIQDQALTATINWQDDPIHVD